MQSDLSPTPSRYFGNTRQRTENRVARQYGSSYSNSGTGLVCGPPASQTSMPTRGEGLPRTRSPDISESMPSVLGVSGDTDSFLPTLEPQPHNDGGDSSPATTHKPTHETLWDVIKVTLTYSSTKPKGKIYVFREADTEEPYYKIGYTEDHGRRMKEHENCCGIKTERVHVSDRDIEHPRRLEKLIHWDLGYEISPRPCNVPRKGYHMEWFTVTKEMAVDIVKQWENFMINEKPFDSDGNLSIVWAYLLEQRSPETISIRQQGYTTQRERWATILKSPTYIDYACAYLSHARYIHRKFCNDQRTSFWQISTIFYSLWTLALCRNMFAFYALVVVLGCAGLTLFSGIPSKKPVNTPKRGKKEALVSEGKL